MEQFYDNLQPSLCIFEGEVMKYTPGFKYQYQSRYLTLNKSEISYYRNEMQSIGLATPLQKIDIRNVLKA